MDKIIANYLECTDSTGNITSSFPVNAETFDYIQTNNYITELLGKGLCSNGKNIVLTGCEITSTGRNSGYVFINSDSSGEIVYYAGKSGDASSSDRCIVDSTSMSGNITGGDITYSNPYITKELKNTTVTSGSMVWSSFIYASNINNMKLYELINALTEKVNSMGSVPIGGIIPFSGSEESVPNNFCLCDGRTLSISSYTELFNLIGTTYNTEINQDTIDNSAKTGLLSVYSKYTSPSSTEFRVPDLRGRFIAGAYSREDQHSQEYELGDEYGTEIVKLTGLQSGVPEHTHSLKDYYFAEHYSAIQTYINNLKKFNIQTYSKIDQIDGNKLGNNGDIDNDNDGMIYIEHNTYTNTAANAQSSHENRPPYCALFYIIRIK